MFIMSRDERPIDPGNPTLPDQLRTTAILGSILGPWVILLYINDLIKCLEIFKIIHFVDYMTAYSIDTSIT